VVFSYTRATWVSLLGAALVYPFLLLRIPFKYPVAIVLIGAGAVFAYQDQLFMRLSQTRAESSDDLKSHVKSISNIASDASNLERINRWKSAWRMFKDHPILGFGPGTYQFQYAPYQEPEEKTIISTNFGTRGTAHSEYLGPLSESGALGFLTRSAIVIYFFYLGFKLYRRLPKGRIRGLSTAVYLGLVTYFTHGVLNNFLTRDKAAVPVWAFIAVLVAVDLYHKEEERERKGLPSGDPEGQ
jgi:O-antigen ligase